MSHPQRRGNSPPNDCLLVDSSRRRRRQGSGLVPRRTARGTDLGVPGAAASPHHRGADRTREHLRRPGHLCLRPGACRSDRGYPVARRRPDRRSHYLTSFAGDAPIVTGATRVVAPFLPCPGVCELGQPSRSTPSDHCGRPLVPQTKGEYPQNRTYSISMLWRL